MLKRRGLDSEDELSASVKRCRIATTPGQLRLHSDVIELIAACVANVQIEKTDDPMCVLVHMSEDGGQRDNISFSYTVSKFYPHQRPNIRCISKISPSRSSFLSHNEEVLHRELHDGWSGICSLGTAVIVLRRLWLSRDGEAMTECGDDVS